MQRSVLSRMADGRRLVAEARTILRRDDEAKLMAIFPASIEEGVAISTVLGGRIELASFPVARGAVTLNIAQMSGGPAN